MLTPHSNGESVVISYGITAAKIQPFFKPPKYFKKKSKKMNTIQKMQKPDISPESVFFPNFAGWFQWLHLPRCKGTKNFTFRKKICSFRVKFTILPLSADYFFTALGVQFLKKLITFFLS